MGIFDKIMALVNWSDLPAVKKQLLDGLSFARGPGRGLDIPRSTLSDADLAPHVQSLDGESATEGLVRTRVKLRLAERALEELVRERQDLMVAKFKKHLTLYFKRDFKATVSGELESQLERDGFLAEAGETLTVGAKGNS